MIGEMKSIDELAKLVNYAERFHQLRVPYDQRPFAWQIEDCDKLADSLMNIASADLEEPQQQQNII
jgi:hypothetical protein